MFIKSPTAYETTCLFQMKYVGGDYTNLPEVYEELMEDFSCKLLIPVGPSAL